MGRTKRPPLVHIPFAPRPEVTRVANHQNTLSTTKTTQILPKDGVQNTETSSEIKSISSTSFEKETPAPVGVTECPHCNVDFKDMAVSDVRDHVESCSRPTTAGSESDTSELSDPPESPKESADQLDGDEDQDSDLEALSDLGLLDGFNDADFIDLPGPYDDDEEDEEGTPSLNEESTSDVKFAKLKDSNEILASLDDIDNMSDLELYRRLANGASVLNTYQKEWMALEKATAKATLGDGVPVLRNPRAVREKIAYEDRLEADVYGFVHNPHPHFLGRQDPIAQRAFTTGDGELRTRLRKQTKKAVEADNESDPNIGESGRPTRNRNTPSRFESQSREQTPSGTKKPRGRGKGGRVGELRSEVDPRPPGARTGSPLANGTLGQPSQSSSSLRDRALASTEADEDSGANSRPTTSSSSQSVDVPNDGLQHSTSRRKRRATSAIDGSSMSKPKKKKKARKNASKASGNANTNSNGATSNTSADPKPRAKNMTLVNGEWKSTQSVMMSQRWAAYKANPGGPRIGRVRKSQSEKDTGSDANSSRKRSLEGTNDQADPGRPGKKRKLTKEEATGEENGLERLERGSQAPAKGKRGGRREGSGRKPAKGPSKVRRQSRTETTPQNGELEAESSASVEPHLDENDRATQTPGLAENEEVFEPSSGSTRASTRARKPSIAKQEADDSMSPSVFSQPAKKAKGQWGGKREKGKRNDGTPIVKSKQMTKSGIPAHLQEGMVADTDQTEDEDDHSHNDEEEEEEEEEVEDEQTPGPQKKPTKRRKGGKAGKASKAIKQNQPPGDEFPDLPVYDKNNPSAEYLALPKNLKMKAVSRARWANGGMGHMFGQKGPNKTTKQKLANQTGSNTASINSARTSVSATHSAPPSTRRRPLFRNMGGLDGSDEHDTDINSNPPTLKRKISEYEEFQALASPNMNQEGGVKRRRRPAALRASTSFIEPNTSSDFEDEDIPNGDEYNDVYGKESTISPGKKEKSKIGNGGNGASASRKGVGGRPPRMMNPIQTDVANAGVGAMRASGGGGGSGLTAYEEFLALSAPGTPMVLGKRVRKSVLRGGEVEGEGEVEMGGEYDEGGDDEFGISD